MVWQLVVVGMIGYLIGSINLSIILGKVMGKGDIREQGSGNAGTTNALRVLGKWPALLVLLFDIFKGFIAIWIGKLLINIQAFPAGEMELVHTLRILVPALATILGHDFPIYYGFKGGKGIATSFGVILAIEPQIALVCLVFEVVLILLSRMVSLGSVVAAILYPVLVIVIGSAFNYKLYYTIFAALVTALALYKHRSNIKRLFNGTENKVWKTKREKREELSNKKGDNA